MLDAPDLPYGALKIHIRTTRAADWSFIEAASISLNGDVMEIGGWGSVIFNGVYTNDKQGLGELPDTFGGYSFASVKSNKITHDFRIQFGKGDFLQIKSFKKLIGVFVHINEDHLKTSHGLMGSTETGDKVGRDGETVFSDNNMFGQEWQVLETEPRLFDSQREPQLPHAKCILPDPSFASSRRRLGETMTRKEAERACANLGTATKEACVYDVMQTGDLEIAGAWYGN